MSAELNLDACRTDHLFVLVGGNTLPNYVAIKLLAEQKTYIYLVYSLGTKVQKDNLTQTLNQSRRSNIIHVPITNESSPSAIETAILRQLAEIPANTTIGLHYTGGTKVMATHTYLTVRDYKEKAFKYCVYSYLDARALALWVERSDRGNTRNPIPIGMALSVTLKDILQLHNRQDLKQKLRQKAIWPDVAEHLVTFFKSTSSTGRNKWLEWCKQRFEIWDRMIEVTQIAHTIRNLSDTDIYELAQVLAQLDTSDAPDWRLWRKQQGFEKGDNDDQKTNAALQQELEKRVFDAKLHPLFQRQLVKNHILDPLEHATGLSLRDSNNTFGDIIAASPFKINDYPYKDFASWLNGGWLEDYVFLQLKSIEIICQLHDCFVGIRPRLPGGNERDFEFDVACMRGYQLFAFSCTTSNEVKLCKQKLLEAVARAHQLGGSEARIALVCCLEQEKLDKLKYDLDALVRENQFRLFGLDDLLFLASKIQTWIEEIDHAAANALANV